MPPKRKPKTRRAPAKRARKTAKAVKRRTTPKRPKKKRRKRSARARSEASKKGWVTRRKRARKRERDSDRGDVEVLSHDLPSEPDESYRAYPLPGERSNDAALERLRTHFRLVEAEDSSDTRSFGDDVRWFPTFDEVYDYIDALVDEFDLDAHELFELAYGYADGEVA